MNIQNIQRAVCEHYNLPLSAMIGKSRAEPINTARQVAIHLCLGYNENTTTKVARYFDRDHSTIVKTNQSFKQRLKRNDDLKADILAIQADLRQLVGVASRLDEMIARNVKKQGF